MADVSQDPNAGTYRALGALGNDALNLGNAIYQKELEIKRKSDAWNAYSSYTQQLSNDKLRAKSRWDKLGNVDDVPYAQYISTRSDDLSREIGEGIEDADTREMFTRMVRPDELQTKVGGVVETQQRKLKAAPEYYMNEAKKIGSEAVDINSLEAKDFVVNKMDKNLQEANDIIGTFDQDSKKSTSDAILLEGGRALADKFTALHLTETATTGQVLSEFTGVNILFDAQQRKYVVDWLKSTTSSSEREQIINDYLQSSASKIQRLIELGGIETKTSPDKIGSIRPYLEDNGSFSMDVIDIEGNVTEKVKLPDVVDPTFGRVENKSTKYFNALPANEKINFYEKILRQKFEINDTSKKEYRLQLDNIIAAPGVDNFNNRGSELTTGYSMARLSQLMNSPMRAEAGVTPTEAGTMVMKFAKNMIIQQASDDLVSFGPSYEMTDEKATAIAKGVAAKVFAPNDPALLELTRPEAGATILGPMNLEVKREFRSMKALWASNKTAFIQKYGNTRYQRIFNNGVDVNGVFNMNVIAQQRNIMDKLNKNFGVAGTSDDTLMFKPSVNNLNIAIERAQQSGPEAVQRVYANISNVDPLVRGRIVKELVKEKSLGDSAEGSTLAYSFLGGTKRDQLGSMQLAEIQDLNTRSSRETIFNNFNSTFGSDSGKFVKSIDARFNDLVKDKLPALYGDATKESQPILKSLRDPVIASVMQKARLGMGDSELESLMDQEFERHIGSRVSSVNEKNIRGVFPKVGDTDTIIDQATEKVDQIKKDIMSGKVKIDYSQYPELNATLLGRKTGKSKFLQPRTKEEQFLNTYDLSFDGVDPFGGSGTLRLMIRGKNNKTAPLKIINGKQSVDYPVDWTVK